MIGCMGERWVQWARQHLMQLLLRFFALPDWPS